MSTAQDFLGDMIAEAAESWDDDSDPKVIELPGERRPVVAVLDVDDLRVLHSGLIDARVVSRDDILAWIDQHDGGAKMGRISDHANRFRADDFLDVYTEDGGD